MGITYPRDIDLFLMLWRHKVLTTRAIWLCLFQKGSLKTCYQRLMKLKKSKHIRRIQVGENGFAWSLWINGYNLLADVLPELNKPGYGSEFPTHDLLVLSVTFGDFWPNLPKGVSFLSESEMKRFHLEHLPPWSPVDLMRTPDGIWRIERQSQHELVAFEIETCLKPVLKYETIARQYQDASGISRVLWFVPTASIAKTIFDIFRNKVGDNDFRHSFILISDLVSNGWNSKIIYGHGSESQVDKSLNINVGDGSVSGRRLCHLDISACPQNSTTSKLLCESAIPNLATLLKTTSFSNLIKSC